MPAAKGRGVDVVHQDGCPLVQRFIGDGVRQGAVPAAEQRDPWRAGRDLCSGEFPGGCDGWRRGSAAGAKQDLVASLSQQKGESRAALAIDVATAGKSVDPSVAERGGIEDRRGGFIRLEHKEPPSTAGNGGTTRIIDGCGLPLRRAHHLRGERPIRNDPGLDAVGVDWTPPSIADVIGDVRGGWRQDRCRIARCCGQQERQGQG